MFFVDKYNLKCYHKYIIGDKVKKYIKDNYKFLIILFLIVIALNIRFPYYIDAPGGISDISKKIEIDGYKSIGSFNIVYVKEYKSTLSTLIYSFFNKDWKVLKHEDVLLDTENDSSYTLRDKLLMEEGISNAIYVAYTKANKDINIISNDLYVAYISSNSNTDLVAGDKIIRINNQKVHSKKEVTHIIEKLNIGDKLEILVENNDKKYERYAKVINDNGNKKIGILFASIKEYKTDPKVMINTDKNESGSSGSFIIALSIYNSLVKEDVTNGLKIVGTGTIDIDGHIGSIGGVEYKLKSAVKGKADIFFVPNDENYNEAIDLKEKNNYNIKIVGISTFDDAIKCLEDVK